MSMNFDAFLRESGPERMMLEIHILRAALHAVTRAWLDGTPPLSPVEQECVDLYVAQERLSPRWRKE